jgi:hypothetical protein
LIVNANVYAHHAIGFINLSVGQCNVNCAILLPFKSIITIIWNAFF